MDISSSLASTKGDTAAIALPPQIAVPAEIRKETFLLRESQVLAAHPTSKVTEIDMIVIQKPSLPTAAA